MAHSPGSFWYPPDWPELPSRSLAPPRFCRLAQGNSHTAKKTRPKDPLKKTFFAAVPLRQTEDTSATLWTTVRFFRDWRPFAVNTFVRFFSTRTTRMSSWSDLMTLPLCVSAACVSFFVLSFIHKACMTISTHFLHQEGLHVCRDASHAQGASQTRSSHESKNFNVGDETNHDRTGPPVVCRDASHAQGHEQSMLNEVDIDFRIPRLHILLWNKLITMVFLTWWRRSRTTLTDLLFNGIYKKQSITRLVRRQRKWFRTWVTKIFFCSRQTPRRSAKNAFFTGIKASSVAFADTSWKNWSQLRLHWIYIGLFNSRVHH